MGTHKSERLPERLRQLLTEAYLANENVYWQQREDLVRKLANKWVAVHNGQVVAVGEDMATVMDEVGKQGLCDAYIEKVGGESVASQKLADICPPLSLNPIPPLTGVCLDATY